MFRNREILLYTIIAAVFTIAAFMLCLFINQIAAVIAAVGCLSVYALCMSFTVTRYKRIARLVEYLHRITNGGTVMDIRENTEGELSILKNEIYRVTSMLTDQAETLRKDKLELANALSDISHQLKTPLTSLGIMADLLDNDNLPPDKRREFIDFMRAGQKRMEWLVLSLLKLAKLDADAVTLKKRDVRLSEIISSAITPLAIPIEVRGQVLSINTEDMGNGEDTCVCCDPEWTTEALGNILKNAVENTPNGGAIEISYGENPIYAFICVHNSGAGIDRADLPHLFKRFYRGRNACRDNVGIGLSMSLAIMRKQHGDIEVTNDNGAVFTLKFYRACD